MEPAATLPPAERARLVERHVEVARRAARMIYPRVAGYIEFDELVALGNAGLAEAAQRYDPSRGAAFATYAWYRVQGAIVDGVRKQSNLPKRVWSRLVALRAASDYLEQRGERDTGAAARGVAAATGADALVAIKAAMSAIRTMYVISLEAGHDAPTDEPALDERASTRQLAARLRGAIDALPDRERAIVTKHYFEDKHLADAGAELGLSKSWASRLHAQAVERLRKMFEDEDTG